MTVTVEGGVITAVEVGDNQTDGIGTKAIAEIPGAIIAINGTEGVDTVSGATTSPLRPSRTPLMLLEGAAL